MGSKCQKNGVIYCYRNPASEICPTPAKWKLLGLFDGMLNHQYLAALSPWKRSRCWPGWRAGGRWCWQESFSSCTPRTQDDGQQGWFKFKHVSIIVEDQKVKRNCIKYLPNILFPNVLCKHLPLKGFSATIILRKLRLCCFDGITFQILFLCVKIWTTLARDKPCRHLSVKMFRGESSGVETQSRRDSERMKRLSNRVTH